MLFHLTLTASWASGFISEHEESKTVDVSTRDNFHDSSQCAIPLTVVFKALIRIMYDDSNGLALVLTHDR